MDQSKLQRSMLEAAGNTLENLAFSEVSESTEKFNIDSADFQIQLDVIKPQPGTFLLNIPNGVLELIAENLFSKPSTELSEDKTNDLLSELLNTLAGNFLNKTLPDDTSFTLGFPQCSKKISVREDDEFWACNFMIEDLPFSIYLKGDIISYLQKL